MRASARPIGKPTMASIALKIQSKALTVWRLPNSYTARYIYNPGTMITIAGTVNEMRGNPSEAGKYPRRTDMRHSDARSPAMRAPINAQSSKETWK